MSPRHAGGRRRRGRAWVAVLLTLGVVATGVLLGMRSDGQEDPANGSGTGPGSPSVSVPPIPSTPTGAPEIGMYVATSVLASGVVEVRQWVSSAQPLTTIDVAATGTEPSGPVSAVDLVVVGGGQVLAHRDEVGSAVEHVALSAASRKLYLTYRLTGAIDRASTVAGRALLRIASLDVDYAGAGGSVRRIVSAPGKVLDVGCLRRGEQAARPCGAPLETGDWFIDLTGPDRNDRLVASIEMG